MKFENIQKLKDLINTSNNIVIIPHTNPDGDALGSCLALKGIFNKLNKNSFVISPNKAPDFYNWIPYFKEIKYFICIFVICLFIFFTGRDYFSDSNKMNSFRSLNTIYKKINTYVKKLPVLENDTNNIIEYVEQSNNKKKKKFNFWKLLELNE